MSTAFQTLDATPAQNSPFSRVESLAELGSLLRDVRRAQSKKITNVAADLRLKANFIEALEKGEWDELPSETYARGYLRQYAEYLHLSPNEAAQCCQRISGKVDSNLQYHAIESSSDNISKGTLWLSAIAIGFILVGWSGYKQSMRAPLEKLTVTPSPVKNLFSGSSFIQLNQLVRATCLNIPYRAITPCYIKSADKPSFLLKNSTIYPIWIR